MKQRNDKTIPLYSEDGFEGTIEPLTGSVSESLRRVIQIQEGLNNKIFKALGVPNHYCESFGEKCDKQCKYCKNEK